MLLKSPKAHSFNRCLEKLAWYICFISLPMNLRVFDCWYSVIYLFFKGILLYFSRRLTSHSRSGKQLSRRAARTRTMKRQLRAQPLKCTRCIAVQRTGKHAQTANSLRASYMQYAYPICQQVRSVASAVMCVLELINDVTVSCS